MSRRRTLGRSAGRATNQPARWVTYDDHPVDTEPVAGDTPWWYATRMPYPWDSYYWHEWPSAWAEVTLSVANAVWSTQGKKLYDVHRDTELRDDLRGWLMLRAVESGADFMPNPWHPAPQAQWGAFLRERLTMHARWHFGAVVGTTFTLWGNAAREAYSRGTDSIERLDQREAEGFAVPDRSPIHGLDMLRQDPAHVVIRLEELGQQVRDVEREDRRAGFYTATGAPPVCLVSRCGKRTFSRGLCASHYSSERRQAMERGDWNPRQSQAGCTVDGCDGEFVGKGMCGKHLQRWHKENDAPPCTVEGCEKPVQARGMCPMHYSRERAQKAKAS